MPSSVNQTEIIVGTGNGGVAGSGKSYAVGTLTYTFRSLMILFAWLLWGDFCFAIFEAIFVNFIPLYLKDLHASNTLIGVMTGSIAGAVNIFFMPHFSMASDRYRSRLGRRIPFLLWSVPCTVSSLILVGYAPEIATWLRAGVLPHRWPVSEGTLALTLLCVFVVMFHFFNMVLVNLFNCLLKDVVPQEVMARFLSSFRIVGALGGITFMWAIFPHVLTYRKMVCVGVGGVYLLAFMLMCFRIKEGDYPPPQEEKNKPGFLKTYLVYFREFLSVPLYRLFFVGWVLVVFAVSCSAPFVVLFARDTLGLSMTDIGRIGGVTAFLGMVAYVPMGFLCDRFSVFRVILAFLAAYPIVMLLAFVLVRDRTSWLIYAMAVAVTGVAWVLASTTAMMKLFPSEKFGQFSTCLVVMGWGGGSIVGNYLIGWFIDFVDGNYRMLFLWNAVFCILAIVPMLAAYRRWKQHGGPDHYIPPLPGHFPGNA